VIARGNREEDYEVFMRGDVGWIKIGRMLDSWKQEAPWRFIKAGDAESSLCDDTMKGLLNKVAAEN
jgi:hypothetical protein